jgi:hypothetical protein
VEGDAVVWGDVGVLPAVVVVVGAGVVGMVVVTCAGKNKNAERPRPFFFDTQRKKEA